MATHPIEEFRRRNMLAGGMRFVLVNERSPRVDASCAACCSRIDRGYLRDARTRLLYCDAQCFADHERMGDAARLRDARRVS
jgi:hypothetical protein